MLQSMEKTECSLIFVIILMLPIVHAGYDHFKLVQQWPRSFCQRENCHLDALLMVPNFTIHGLWPNSFCQALRCCEQETYEVMPADAYFVKRLVDAWPDLTRSRMDTQQEQVFWQREWEKHGTCCINTFEQFHYFDMAILLKNRFNLHQILEDYGLQHGQPVALNHVNDAIAAATGEDAIVVCDNRGALSEIIICFDANGDSVVSCRQKSISSSCKNLEVVNFP